MVSADHGSVETDPKTTIYLNRESRFSGLEKYLARNHLGRILTPAGSARDYFLYIAPGLVDEARDYLATRLEGMAEVRKVADLVSAGWFGSKVTSHFLQRCGQLVILPNAGKTVWWFEKDRFDMHYFGHHGGLTPQEMEIPLLTLEL